MNQLCSLKAFSQRKLHQEEIIALKLQDLKIFGDIHGLMHFVTFYYLYVCLEKKKGKRKVQGVPQSQTAALPRPKEEEETDKSKQAQTEQKYVKH